MSSFPLSPSPSSLLSFFFNHPSSTDIYTLSLHDALPILPLSLVATTLMGFVAIWQYFFLAPGRRATAFTGAPNRLGTLFLILDRKSTRLNSSHVRISYAVFCLKKKKKTTKIELYSHKHTN